MKIRILWKEKPLIFIFLILSGWPCIWRSCSRSRARLTRQAEDCLSLNIYLPHSRDRRSGQESSNLIHTPSRAKSRDLNCVNFELWKLVMHFRRYCMKNCTLCTSMLQSQMLQIWMVTMKAFHINTWSTKLVGCMVKCQRGENPWWMQIWSLNIYRSKSLCCLWKFSISCQL